MHETTMIRACSLALAGVLATMVSVAGQLVTNDWENLAVNSRNRLPARTYSMPLASEADALSDALEPETPWKKSLNGTWRLSWAGNPELRVKDFWKTDFDDSAWFSIPVPACVEMHGFGAPGYTNVRYPHKDEWPLIRDRQSGKADYNPVSSYRTKFSVPKTWKGRQVVLRFDGVYSAYYVWVNGVKVGYAEDSKLPSEFDVTAQLKDGENVLAVEVYRWCDGSYLEDQDMFRYSGIFRDVTLWAKPKDGIWDFEVKTELAGDFSSANVALKGLSGDWSAVLYDAAKKPVAKFAGEASAVVESPRLWSAEDPYLYTLVVKKGDDIRRRRIGFKSQKIVGNTILVNGKKVKFKGVNRHEASPEAGRAITLDDMMADITLLKRYNINTVRTAHYPDHHLWYDLCDIYGIYLVAEANVEGHEPSYGEKGLGRFKEWEYSIVERNVRHILFYRNHPSITLWSLGNETGHGDCFRKAYAEIKAIDATRPVHWERGNPDVDVDSRMYPTVEWLKWRGELGDKPREDKNYDGWPKENGQTPGKAFFMCEYAHAMGNAIGNFQEYWDVFYAYDSLTGGCIWDWIDQSVWKDVGRIDPRTGKPERVLAYGGDFDEQPNDGPFCNNGIIGPERKVTAKLLEVAHVHRNLIVRKADAGLELENRFCFTRADAYDGRWELVVDGKVAKSGTFAVPPVAPLSKAPLALPAEVAAVPGAECFVNVSFHEKSATRWAGKGWPVSRNQIALSQRAEFTAPAADSSFKVREDKKSVTVFAGGTKAVFSRKTGTLCELTMGGRRILRDLKGAIAAGPRLTCMRAFTDNDIWLRKNKDEKGSIYVSGVTQLRYHARPITVSSGVVRTSVLVTGQKSAGFTHETEWRFSADGSVVASHTAIPHGTMPGALPRLGCTWLLDDDLENMRWYGRGPGENYIDRLTASFFGEWASTVSSQFEEYVRPQDNGYKCDVRWVELTDEDGKGVRFSASEPLFVQASHFGWEDLEFSRHRNGQQRMYAPLMPRKEVCLNLDIRQLGLGGASCGPKPMDKYIFPVKNEAWTVRIDPVSR